MTYARKALISLNDTPYYHVMARCVRRARLWGFDEYAGQDYSHRKAWIIERLEHLTSVFAIDICAFAIMSNHYHLVLHVDQQRIGPLTTEEVIQRWTRLFRAPPAIDRYLSGEASDAERKLAESIVAVWRERLSDVSWLMKCLNEHLARRANAEDGCTGKFWEGRFRSQALLDEAGLLTAMAYVDLNPIRAGVAATPEESEFTSIQVRIQELRRQRNPAAIESRSNLQLHPFRSNSDQATASIPFRLVDYLELVDWTGRAVHPDKPGRIDDRLPAIIQRLSIDSDAWRIAMRPHGNVFGRAMGRLSYLRLHARTLGQSWVRGLRSAERLYCH